MDWSYLNFNAKDDFFKLSDNIDGKKSIILDSELFDIFNQLFSFSEITSHNIKDIYLLNNTESIESIKTKNIIYIIHPIKKSCDLIIKHIINDTSNKQNYHIFCVPYKEFLVSHYFEYTGIFHLVNFNIWQVYIIKTKNILTSTYPAKFSNNLVDILIYIQEYAGIIPYIQGIGNKSLNICNNLLIQINNTSYRNKNLWLNNK